MSTEDHSTLPAAAAAPHASVPPPPTTPCTVVWSQGHPYVLDLTAGACRWIGADDRGRPVSLTRADLQRRGWSLRPAS